MNTKTMSSLLHFSKQQFLKCGTEVAEQLPEMVELSKDCLNWVKIIINKIEITCATMGFTPMRYTPSVSTLSDS